MTRNRSETPQTAAEGTTSPAAATFSGVFEDIGFRSLAAPGLDEDDLFAALDALAGSGALWGDGRPPPSGPPRPPWDEVAERRRRHDALLAKWPPRGPEAPPPA